MVNTQVKLTNVAANNRILNKYGEDVTGAKGIPLSDGTVQYPNVNKPNIEAVNYAKQHYTYAHMKPSLTAADRAFLEEQGFEDATPCRRVSDAALFNPAWKSFNYLIVVMNGMVFDLNKQKVLNPYRRTDASYMYYSLKRLDIDKYRTVYIHGMVAYSFAPEYLRQAYIAANKEGTCKVQPDHINNQRDDNRLENLQIVLEYDNKSVLKTSRK